MLKRTRKRVPAANCAPKQATVSSAPLSCGSTGINIEALHSGLPTWQSEGRAKSARDAR